MYSLTTNQLSLKILMRYQGSDMAQIGWVEISTENGGSGYLWYLKSEHETRLRFEDYLETAMIEAVPAAPGSGGEAALSTSAPAAGTQRF
jgi:predicted secreted protein